MASEPDSPAGAEPEVSLFGPGIGECVVVHLGDGEWLIVDSCIDPATKRPVALDYLTRIGVNVATQVKLIVVSHWHNDHIRGAAEVVSACEQAKFACSIALNNKEFKTLLRLAESDKIGDSGVEEFRRIINVLLERKAVGARSAPGPDMWALVDRELYTGATSSVVALSPSDATCSNAMAAFARLIPGHGQPIRRFVSPAPNDICTVLRVKAFDYEFLLGSDLEVGVGNQTGWGAILASPQRSSAMCFKVAHHGSPNAHHADVWSSMLSSEPVAMLTPFRAGSRPLPAASDRQRILALTPRAYCTAPLQSQPKQFSDSAVKKIVRATVSDVRPLLSPMGQIRVRVRNGEPDVQLFGSAKHLSALTG